MLDLKEEALFINNDTELCMFKEDGSIHLYNKNGIWNHPFFRDIIVDKNIKYVDEL